MRIIAIGLGGAGSRIVDTLYSTDRRSSKVPCVQGLAVDVSETTLQQLTGLPENARVFFPAMDPVISVRDDGNEPTATIDIGEIVSRINNVESGETDALIICMGLGGSMTDIAPHIIAGLRSSTTEPIFGLVTLPCLAEGEKRSAKAADDIDTLSPLLDGMILFDNETWYKKTKTLMATIAQKEKGLATRLGFGKREPEISAELATYQALNEMIVRRISLILRAGEFKADGGIDLAEVVLDSGEVINTMKGMGFITIGYAVERLPSNPLSFLTQFRPQGHLNEESKKRASRIVELAKQAIYHEVSTPCDMTSAHKALVLIAGPSQELSMKGFMTVRKWIDRSIAGLETRSGDYPVVNTKNVAIIIMLSGLENIPRVTELQEIRTQHRSRLQKRAGGAPEESFGAEQPPADTRVVRDEMIVLPEKMRKQDETAIRIAENSRHSIQIPAIKEAPLPSGGIGGLDSKPIQVPEPTAPVASPPQSPTGELAAPGKSPIQRTARHRVVVSDAPAVPDIPPGLPHHLSRRTPSSDGIAVKMLSLKNRSPGTTGTTTHGDKTRSPEIKDAARQRIEIALQKQRLKAISGPETPAPGDDGNHPAATIRGHKTIVKRPEDRTPQDTQHTRVGITSESAHTPVAEGKTLIIPKKKRVIPSPDIPLEDNKPDTVQRTEMPADSHHAMEEESNHDDDTPEETPITFKSTPFRAKDNIFKGREVSRAVPSPIKDSSLLDSRLKPKKGAFGEKSPTPAERDEKEYTPEQEERDTDTTRKGKR